MESYMNFAGSEGGHIMPEQKRVTV